MTTTDLNADNTNTTNFSMVTDLFLFTDIDDNKYVISGFGSVDTESDEANDFVKMMAKMIAEAAGFTMTNEIHHVGVYEEGKTQLPHYMHGTIHSLLGQYEVLLIGGPKFNEFEVDRKKGLN